MWYLLNSTASVEFTSDQITIHDSEQNKGMFHGPYIFIARHHQFCVDVQDRITTNGHMMQLWECVPTIPTRFGRLGLQSMVQSFPNDGLVHVTRLPQDIRVLVTL
jgi:hypothetical protein